MRRAAAGLFAALLVAAPSLARATHEVGHPDWSCCAAVRTFAADFPVLRDSEWGYPLGGWGGIGRGAPIRHTPVVFVHGNSADASFWDLQNESAVAVNVRQRFRDAGYSDQELWALSYNGQGCGDNTCQTSNDVNVPDLTAFLRAVLDYTDAPSVDIVAHSLGVTLVRRTLQVHPELLGRVEDAIFASGANHGTTVCRGAERINGCDEIAPGTPWLEALNADETPGRVRYVTVCDCTGVADHFFLGIDAHSPQLAGADNIEIPASAHFMTARGPDAFARYLPLVERVTPRAPHPPVVAGRTVRRAATTPETGVGSASAPGVLALAIALAGASRLRRGARA